MLDVFNTPKLLVATTGACSIIGIAVVAALRGHELAVPRTPAIWGAGAFIAVAAAATVFSTTPMRSFAGASGARAGLLLYLACAVVFVAAATLYRTRSPAEALAAVLAAAVAVVAYGAVQALGLDPLRWRTTAGGPLVFATFGNANFFSAWSGIVVVAAVWGASSRTWTPRWRMVCAVLAVAIAVVALASQSIQGPLAAVAGVAVLAAVRVSDRGRHATSLRRRTMLYLALPVAASAAVAAILATRGDAAGSLATRIGKWEAALAMARARPLTGFGLDLFGDWYHAYRPVSDAVDRGLAHTADAAHSVPLQLLTGGGIPLLVAYVCFVVGVVVAALRALRPAQGERRLMLGALLGAYAAYHVQAVVSIDVPALALLHWLLAGLLVGAAAGPPRNVALHRPHPRWRPGQALAATVAACLVLAVLTVPIRAEVAGRRATRFAAQERHASAERAFGIALRLNPWEPRYALELARERLHRGDVRLALDAYSLAQGRDPRSMIVALEQARATHQARRHAEATARYDRVLQLDPRSPHLLAEAARHHLRWGDPHAAVRLLERAVAVDDRALWRRLLQRARREAAYAGSA